MSEVRTACEVLVVGGGPSGAATAAMLARRGVDVILLVSLTKGSDRPQEVLSPWTRRLLLDLGFEEPRAGKAECHGVLSCWGSEDPDYQDYRFLACGFGLAVCRRAFHQSLIESARRFGARVLANARLRRGQLLWGVRREIEVVSHRVTYKVSTRWVIDATGRQGALALPPNVNRNNFDELLAFWTPFEREQYGDRLVLEASREGWWYVPPDVGHRTSLVFLTDRDLVPRGISARKEWLSRCFGTTHCLRKLARHGPTFDYLAGADASFSRLNVCVSEEWFAVGDRALSLDPLSGNGVTLALAGAAHLVESLCGGAGANTKAYADWCDQKFEDEMAVRSDVYSRVHGKYLQGDFWNRRYAA